MTTNNFQDDMSYEQRCRNRFDSIYMTYFNALKEIHVIIDRQLQFKGHDIHLVFDNKTWIIDEKIRRKDWGDILIEHISNFQTGRKGWIYNNESDFLAYLFPTYGFWLLDTQKIKKWVTNEKSSFWTFGFTNISAENENQYGEKYTTISRAIPFQFLEDNGFVYYKVLNIEGCP